MCKAKLLVPFQIQKEDLLVVVIQIGWEIVIGSHFLEEGKGKF